MLFDKAGSVRVDDGQLSNDSNWNFVGGKTVRHNSPTAWEEIKIAAVSHGVYELKVEAASAKFLNRYPQWSQSGWLNIRRLDTFRDSEWCPLGKTLVYVPPGDFLSLWFKPVRWLPSIKYQFRRFTGTWSEQLQSIEDKIDSIESPASVYLDLLTNPDSPLAAIQEQIDRIPDRITDTFEVLLDAGEINDGPE